MLIRVFGQPQATIRIDQAQHGIGNSIVCYQYGMIIID
jgi:hypothetical protein